MSLLNIQQQSKTDQQEGIKRYPSKRIHLRPETSYRFIIPDDQYFVQFFVHYVWQPKGGAYIKCLGDECPICERNREIEIEHPEEFRSVGEYSSLSKRYSILVWDLTEYKYCKECGSENGVTNAKCWKCGNSLSADKESANAWKALPLAKTYAASLSASLNDFISEMGLKFGEFYTKMTVVPGEGNKKSVSFTHFPLKEKFEKEIDFKEEVLLEYSVAVLSREEIVRFLNGESISSIFKNRRLEKQQEEQQNSNENEETAQPSKKEVDDVINELFGE